VLLVGETGASLPKHAGYERNANFIIGIRA
jgi:hypothetical protein